MQNRLSRRAILGVAIGTGVACALPRAAAAEAKTTFAEWVEAFRPRALARGVSSATYTRVMGSLRPDTSVYAQASNQPEFSEPLWKYLNRRVSAWRIMTGKERARTHAALLARIEAEFGVDPFILLGVWGMETAFGDLAEDPRYVRPVIASLAALAFGEPRRRVYWESELINALTIIERGWASEKMMVGSWAGAMGHTQWMPEVWLRIGLDYDRDGRVSPFGPPDDALASTARYLVDRGKFRRGLPWGFEVISRSPLTGGTLSLEAWSKKGVTRAHAQTLPASDAKAKLWIPVSGGPAFLLTHNFNAIYAYNPSMNYALAVLHLADRIRGGDPLVRAFPGSERALTLEELQDMQARLTQLGYDTYHRNGRVGREMIVAVRQYQQKVGLAPADGYPGLQVLARLRQGP